MKQNKIGEIVSAVNLAINHSVFSEGILLTLVSKESDWAHRLKKDSQILI